MQAIPYKSEHNPVSFSTLPVIGRHIKFITRNINGLALVESVSFLSFLVMLNMLLGDGTRFIAMPLHPFWAIILFVIVQYGPGEALVTALLASVFLLAGNMPEQTFTETMYEYIFRVMYLPLLWIITALVLGSIRSRHLQERKDLTEKLYKCRATAKTVADGYNVMKQAKEQLEMRLARERCSVLSVYNIAQSLETVDPANVHLEIAKLVKLAFNPDKFSIYIADGESMRLKISYGWENTNSYVARYDAGAAFSKYVLKHKKFLNIIHSEDEMILGGQGMLAGPIIDTRTGKVFGMLKIEDMAFMDLGARNQEIFQVVCKWAGRIYANVDKYKNKENERHVRAIRENTPRPPSYIPSPSNIAAAL